MYSKNYLKKIGSVALAGVMALSLSIPAFAAGGDTEKKDEADTTNTSTKITTTFEEIPIAVTVPDTGTAQINPYGLPVDVKDSKNAVLATITGQQITTQPLYITNDGDIALSVGATVTAETTGDANLVTSAISTTGKNANTGKDIYAYLQMATVTSVEKTEVGKDPKSELETPVATMCADSSAWSSTNNLVLNPDEEATKSGIVTLGAQTEDTDKKVYYGTSVAAFRLAGNCVTAPADDEWNDEDGFTATIAFTFTPADTSSSSNSSSTT
jgi:hypothetical protein